MLGYMGPEKRQELLTSTEAGTQSLSSYFGSPGRAFSARVPRRLRINKEGVQDSLERRFRYRVIFNVLNRLLSYHLHS